MDLSAVSWRRTPEGIPRLSREPLRVRALRLAVDSVSARTPEPEWPRAVPRPIMRIRQFEEHRWWFLGYEPPFESYDRRWYIEARPEQEGLFAVCCFPFTAERALEMLALEVAIMPDAMDEIRRQAR